MEDALPVAVEIAPLDSPREHVDALLGACSRAVADAACVLSSETTEGAARAVAIVTWKDDGSAHIEVGLRRDGHPEWRTRTLEFDTKDAVGERWRTVGFIVGTLSRPELLPTSEEPVSPPQPPPRRDPPAEPPPASPPPVVSARPVLAALDVGGIVGPALEGVRIGALLRARWSLDDSLRALIGLQYLELPTNERGVSARWLTASAGAAWVLGNSRTELAFALDARAEYMGARAVFAESRVFPGVGVGATGAWMPGSLFGLFAGGEAAWLFGTTELGLGAEAPMVDGTMRFNAEAGVRIRLR